MSVRPEESAGSATVAELLRRASAKLRASDNARLDGEILLAHALDSDRTALYRDPDAAVPQDIHRAFERLIAVRASGRPIAQILERTEFWSLSLEVDEHVLIPRPETERLVELALEHAGGGAVVADLGCGSGAIAIAIASELPAARVFASDRSVRALRIAQRNAKLLVPDRIRFVQADWLAPFAGASIDVVVSNPPYIEAGDPLLTQSDIRFEPIDALAAGKDGLVAIRRLVAEAPRVLKPGGWLVLEHGYNQATRVRELMRKAGFEDLSTARDLGGRERISSGRIS